MKVIIMVNPSRFSVDSVLECMTRAAGYKSVHRTVAISWWCHKPQGELGLIENLWYWVRDQERKHKTKYHQYTPATKAKSSDLLGEKFIF